MLLHSRTYLRDELLDHLLKREGEGYVSMGTSIAQAKELTLCLVKAQRAKWARAQGALVVREVLDDLAKTKILLGVAFGQLVNPVEKRVEIGLRGGEVVSGRIDYLPGGIPSEIKVTWAKPKDAADVDPQYLEQLASYAIAEKVQLGRLYVLYAGGWKPELRCYAAEFSHDELISWYDELERRAYAINSTEPISPVGTHYGWECGRCPHSPDNGGDCTGTRENGKTVGFFTPR
mgnify:FL=1